MSGSPQRQALWSAAASLIALAGDGPAGGRYRRLLAPAPAPPLRFEDLLSLPSWSHLDPERLSEFACLVGVVRLAPVWARRMDGKALRAAAAIIGEAALEAAIQDASPWRFETADLRPVTPLSLATAGAAALLAAAAPQPFLAAALAVRFPDIPPLPDTAAAAWAVRRAHALWEA